jgi:hypothetical protein
VHRGPNPARVVESAPANGPHEARSFGIGPRIAEQPYAAVGANPPFLRPAARRDGNGSQSCFFSSGPKAVSGYDNGERESAARDALTISAVTSVNTERYFRDLVSDRAAHAAAAKR